MEANEVQKLQIVHKSSQLLKRTLQFLLSLSLFSLLVCYSAGFSFDPHSFNVCFSTLLFSVFTRTIDRKCLFLICNGILVFIAKTSSSPPLSDLNEKPSAEDTIIDDQQFIIGSVDDTIVAVVAEDQEHKEVEEEVEEGEDVSLLTSNNESEDDVIAGEDTNRAENWSVMKQEIEDMEASNEELLSTDELNRKVEEFIRKMKEEIRIEAQQQLIAV